MDKNTGNAFIQEFLMIPKCAHTEKDRGTHTQGNNSLFWKLVNKEKGLSIYLPLLCELYN